MAKRKIEQWIGFIGGLIGVVLAGLALAISHVSKLFGGVASLSGPAYVVLLFSLIGLFGALMVSSRKHDGGIIMIVIGVAGLIALGSVWFAAPFILLIIAGAIALL
ncbi:MAG: hypothetical protein AMDU1_APLC00014G0021 [Thermoplasmatales archaeon A-plasma]|jgi:hypothetical protein|nr:MAG: hypothetical protein AMDU1_APLC00014G0021 [Thermoplasmatales archaeon A-plasma]MCL4331334.1 hypothetical protein [Candidatus Thermoplasmatota archaeon]MCL5732478.1 hypothetical protein [Candidatus Thermoplasmatota archaeon]WMT44233.1 MAG: hypothetical protein RE469_08495 [Cuniculiplasma divulgatum]